MYAEASPPGVPTLAPTPLSEEEVMGQGPVVRPSRWVIADVRSGRWVNADVRSGELETEPARNNLARTYTLLGVAERLQQLVSEELVKIRGMKDVVSRSRLKALAKMRVWYMEHSFHRQLRSHVDLFRREMDVMREVFGHFDSSAIERETGGPTLRIMQELSSVSASTSAPAAPPTASASGVHAPDAGESGDGKTTYNVEVEAGAIISSRECARVSTEEVAAGGASTEEVAAGAARVSEEAARPEWSPGRLEKKKPEGASSSSSGKSSDSLMSSASALQGPSPSASEDVVVDTLLAESEARAASDAMSMLQWVLTHMSNGVSRHIAVADSILRHDQQRSLLGLGDDGVVEEQEEALPTPQRQLVFDLGLMLSQMHKTQGCLSWSVATLQHILGMLPPIPSAVRLPSTPPSADAGGHLARFSQIFKKPFLRSK